jgi:hypothetical protein
LDAVKLRITPIHGWGWRAPDNTRVEVPIAFVLEAEEAPDGHIAGRVSDPGHPLDGMWLLLTQRHVQKDGMYNLKAYAKQPTSSAEPDDITGYAEVAPQRS